MIVTRRPRRARSAFTHPIAAVERVAAEHDALRAASARSLSASAA